MFMLTKNERYYYDPKAILDPNGRNCRSVWNINTQAFSGAHFATFPPKLIEPCILSSSRVGDFILDPFFGSGTVGVVSEQLNRRFIGIELHPEYVTLASQRLAREKSCFIKVAC